MNPLLDMHLLDLLVSMPYKYRLNKTNMYIYIKRMYPELARIPYAVNRNDLEWYNIYNLAPNIDIYIKNFLLETSNSFDRYLNKRKISLILDDYFKSIKESASKREFRFLHSFRGRIKAYHPFVRVVRQFRKPWKIDTSTAIFRVLALKTWFDIFVDDREHLAPNEIVRSSASLLRQE